MNWLELTIDTAPGGIETVAAALTAARVVHAAAAVGGCAAQPPDRMKPATTRRPSPASTW